MADKQVEDILNGVERVLRITLQSAPVRSVTRIIAQQKAFFEALEKDLTKLLNTEPPVKEEKVLLYDGGDRNTQLQMAKVLIFTGTATQKFDTLEAIGVIPANTPRTPENVERVLQLAELMKTLG